MQTVAVTAPGRVARIETPVPRAGSCRDLVLTKPACPRNPADGDRVAGRRPGRRTAFPVALGHGSIGVAAEVAKALRAVRERKAPGSPLRHG